MRAGDGDCVRLEPHQLGQHLGARNHRNRPAPRFGDFRIVVAHRGRTHDDVSVADIFRLVPFGEFNAHLLQPISHARVFEIGTRHAEAEVDQHLCDAGHADAADADEMNVLNATKHKSSCQLSVVSC